MILEYFISNPHLLIIIGLFLIMLSMVRRKMNFTDLLEFWLDFILYLVKSSSKIDRYREKNPEFDLSGWSFVIGFALLLSGVIRLLA